VELVSETGKQLMGAQISIDLDIDNVPALICKGAF
jgi:hypothetical protein